MHNPSNDDVMTLTTKALAISVNVGSLSKTWAMSQASNCTSKASKIKGLYRAFRKFEFEMLHDVVEIQSMVDHVVSKLNCLSGRILEAKS